MRLPLRLSPSPLRSRAGVDLDFPLLAGCLALLGLGGRAVAMKTVTRLLRRSISTEETPAWFRRPLTKPRMRRSSCS